MSSMSCFIRICGGRMRPANTMTSDSYTSEVEPSSMLKRMKTSWAL